MICFRCLQNLICPCFPQEDEKRLEQAVKISREQNPRFHIQEIPPLDPICKKTRTILSKWENLADDKKDQATNPTAQDRFYDSSVISHRISGRLDLKLPTDRVFLCIDDENVMQSIAIVENDGPGLFISDGRSLSIKYLASHPNNIRHSVNSKEKSRVPGAGTALVHHIFQTCIKEGKDGVLLQPIDSSTGFYQKLGFYNGWIHMSISSEEIRLLSENTK